MSQHTPEQLLAQDPLRAVTRLAAPTTLVMLIAAISTTPSQMQIAFSSAISSAATYAPEIELGRRQINRPVVH